ncbi:PIG-L family deacetylase [bacterium]|nr:PIG-L family deacetylase [bacterium]
MSISANNPAQDNSSRLSRIFEAKRVLFIGAHPDDIEFYCGGLVHMLGKNGTQITFAIATRGGKGHNGWMKKRLEKLRTTHQFRSAAILGGVDVVFCDYPDKSLASHIDAYASDLKTLIKSTDPDIIFSWDPDYIYNPHPDHQASADAGALASAGRHIFYYGTREPDLWVGFDEDVYSVKLKSLRAHRTETPWYYWLLIRGAFIKKLIGEGAKVSRPYAETLRSY